MSDKKLNGSGNGADKKDSSPSGIIEFPSSSERARRRKEQEAAEKRVRAEYKAAQKAATGPLFNIGNIPPFARFFCAAIIVAHVILFVFLDAGERLKILYDFGFIPGAFTGAYEGRWTNWLSPLTHMLIHGGWMHMAVNALMGLALCTFFERHFGTRTAVLFVLLCGLSGALVYALINPFTEAPVIGASGATSGLFAAVLLLLSQNGKMGPIGRKGPWPVIAFWAALMTLIGVIGGGGIAWQAHLGGFLAGAGITALMLKGKLRF